MRINTNAQVTVTLTRTGALIYEAHMGQFPSHVRERKLAGDTLTTQLWGLMQVFGDGIHMGMGEVPFVDNVVVLDEKQECVTVGPAS